MTGIEILATQEVVTEFAFNWIAFWITFGVAFGIFVVAGIFTSLDGCDWRYLPSFIIIGIMLGLILGWVMGGMIFCTPAYEIQYKVIISDEVPMNEFLEKYEIIDQEGKIYTIRER